MKGLTSNCRQLVIVRTIIAITGHHIKHQLRKIPSKKKEKKESGVKDTEIKKK